MRTACTVALLFLLVAASAAQMPTAALYTPESDIYVGYTTTFPDYGSQYNSYRLSGAEIGYTTAIRPHLSLTASGAVVFGTVYSVKQFSGTVGPKLNLLTGKVRPYIIAQAGFAYQNSNGMYASDHHPPLAKGATDTESGFTYRVGGGLDIQLSHKLYWRAAQFDLQPQPWGRHTPFYTNWGTGLGYRF